MNETNETNTPELARLTAAAEALDAAMTRVVQHLESQGELSAKVDRIVAALDVHNDETGATRRQLEQRVAELERTNTELKAQATQLTERAARKTLPPLMTSGASPVSSLPCRNVLSRS